MVKRIIIVILCLVLGIVSCTKDSPADAPVVQISSPYSLAIFNVPCTIQVTGHISDSKSLTAVNIYLANSNNIPVASSVPITITSNNMNVSFAYTVDDIHLPSGQYYMTITASNGTNTGSAFQQIYIDAPPTKRTAIYAITRNGAGVHVWKIDSLFHASLSYTVPGDYSSSYVNSYYQQLYIAAHDSGNVSIYGVPNVASEWSITGGNSPSPYFTNVYCYNDAEFVSCYNPAYIKCYNHQGPFQLQYAVNMGYYPIQTFLWKGCLFTEEKSISSSAENLQVFYQASTAGLEQTTLPGPVVAMYGYDANHVFIFGNKTSGGPYLLQYNIQTNLFYAPVSMPLAQLLSATQVDESDYLVSFNDGTIYKYTYGANGMLPYINGITASVVRYDSINSQLIASAGNMIKEYNCGVNSAALAASTTVSDSVRDVRILYNK